MIVRLWFQYRRWRISKWNSVNSNIRNIIKKEVALLGYNLFSLRVELLLNNEFACCGFAVFGGQQVIIDSGGKALTIEIEFDVQVVGSLLSR